MLTHATGLTTPKRSRRTALVSASVLVLAAVAFAAGGDRTESASPSSNDVIVATFDWA